jgi:hypothetical protein
MASFSFLLFSTFFKKRAGKELEAGFERESGARPKKDLKKLK